MTVFTVASGVTSTLVLSSGDALKVSAGGTSSDSTVLGGASELVLTSGLSLDDTVSSGGVLTVSDGGAVSGATISDGGLINLDDGALPTDVTVSSGGTAAFVDGLVIAGDQITLGGPQSVAGTVDGGGVTIEAGGFATMQSVDVEAGGTVNLAPNALYTGSVFVDTDGVLQGTGELGSAAITAFDYIYDYGLIGGVQIGDFSGNAADLLVFAGGATVSTVLANGYVQLFGHGLGIGISAVNGEVLLSAGAETIGDLIVGDGQEYVNQAAKSLSAIIADGGVLTVVSGGIAKYVTVADGGLELDYGDAGADAAVVLSGGVFAFGNTTLSSGRRVASEETTSTVTFDGVVVSSGGAIGYETATINSGATLILRAGGFAADTSLEGGSVLGPGDLTGVNEGGYVSGADIAGGVFSDDAGEVVDVTVGGDAVGSMYVAALASEVRIVDGAVNVYGGGSVINAGVTGPDSEMVLYSGGTATAVNLVSGGELALSGGSVFNVLITSGGRISAISANAGELQGRILDGGVVSGGELALGALLQVNSGAVAVGVAAQYGALVRIASGGLARDIDSISGSQIVDAGALAYDAAAELGGSLSGHGHLVDSGGLLDVTGDLSDFAGELIIRGGVVKLATRLGPRHGEIDFAPGAGVVAGLHLNAISQPVSGTRFGETLIDFDSASDQLDLIGQAFVSGARASLVGHTLTLIDGAYEARFTLSGTTAAHYQVTSDGAGGTLITAAATTMVQALAAFGGTGGATLTPSSSAVTSRFSALAASHA